MHVIFLTNSGGIFFVYCLKNLLLLTLLLLLLKDSKRWGVPGFIAMQCCITAHRTADGSQEQCPAVTSRSCGERGQKMENDTKCYIIKDWNPTYWDNEKGGS